MELYHVLKSDITSPTKTVVVFRGFCATCKKRIKDDCVVYALGYPYFCTVHHSCLPFFDYNSGWPHDKPMQHYENNSTSLS